MTRRLSFCPACLASLAALCLVSTASAREASNNLANLGRTAWKRDWSTARGSFKAVDDVPEGDGVDGESSLAVTVTFKKGFSFYNIVPVEPEIPGRPRRVSVWAKRRGAPIPCIISFTVKNHPKGKKYEWSPKLTEDWRRYSFEIPAGWPEVESLKLVSWNRPNAEVTGTYILNNLSVTTDISGVEDRSSLLKVSALTGRPRNIFRHDEHVSYRLSITSWLGEELGGSLGIRVSDLEGASVYRENAEARFREGFSRTLSFKPKSFGIHEVTLRVALDGQKEFEQRSRCVWIPEIAEPTDEEKRLSPWGINIHGGKEGVAYDSIAKLGFVWIRDYAYTYDWLIRGRDNGGWGGWPWYLPMDKKIREAGLKLLPCMSGGIAGAIRKNAEPPADWKHIIIRLMMKFPGYDAFEPDNELDLHMPRELEADGYRSYGRYHEDLARTVHFMNPDAWAVSQGTAGFKSDVARRMIREGYFRDIDVVNGHFYTGIYPCLLSQHNANTGQSGSAPSHFYDNVREFVAASDSDGRDRQSWITEFGWDTLAVKIVSEKEQAAYAQRGYTLGLVGGLDKMFWYWNLDTTKPVPDTFFDGMGIFDPRGEPKPVAAAVAAMVHFLKLPKPVGSFDMGPNSYGHVFEDRGRLVALAFKIDKDKPGPTATFRSGRLHDMYANPLAGRTHELDIAPIWIDGIGIDDPLVRATAYELKSKWLVLGAGGDECEIAVAVKNNGKRAIDAEVETILPDRWTVVRKLPAISVAPGARETFTTRVRIDPQAGESTEFVDLAITEGDVRRKLRTQVQVVPPASAGTIALSGAPGACDLAFTVTNNSLRARSFTVRPRLPEGWKADPVSLELKSVPAKGSADASFRIEWNRRYSEADRAMMSVFDREGNEIISRGIIPNAARLPRVGTIRFDGDFADWPADAKLPSWALGRIGTPETAEIYCAYASEGLYVGARIAPSAVVNSQPKTFWSMDCLEVCVDTRNDKTRRSGYAKTDHQFWIVPMVEQERAYLGRWKRNDEIAATRYDIEGVKSFAGRIGNGYSMELLIPAEAITGFRAAAGREIGLSLNLTSPGRTGTINVYWPLPKGDGVITKPWLWGNVMMD